MKKNVFKYLRKKIHEHSTITEEVDDIVRYYKIECLGFVMKVGFAKGTTSKKLATGLLIDRLVENPDFLVKLEQVENRKDNLKTLLD
jgi:hypothetical protein